MTDVSGQAALLTPQMRRRWERYAVESRRPLVSLAFLLPLVLLYEYAAAGVLRAGGPGRELLVHNRIHGVLSWFGIVGVWVPVVVLVASLLVWHGLRRERWRVRPNVLPIMVGESAVLTVPLLVLSALFHPALPGAGVEVRAQLVRALGAGIYEELVFRLLLIGALMWLATEILRLRGASARWSAVAASAVVFSLAHLAPIGAEPFLWETFGFRLAAGLYLAIVFTGRGLGIASGCHVAYNLLLVWLRG